MTTAPAQTRPLADGGPPITATHRGLVLASAVAAVGLVLGGHLVHGSVPPARANIARVTAFYRANDGRIYVGSVLIGLAAFAFLGFAALLRDRLPAGDRPDPARVLASSGAVVFAVGLTLLANVGVALGHQPARLDPAAIQALHAVFFDVFAPIGIGAAAFLIGNGLVIVKGHQPAAWLGWSAIAVGALALAPEPVGDVGLVGLGLWILAASVATTTPTTSQ